MPSSSDKLPEPKLIVPDRIIVTDRGGNKPLPTVPVTPLPEKDYLTREEYEEAIDNEIELKLKENDLKELEGGNLPLRMAAKLEQKRGLWRLIFTILKFVGKFF